MRAMRTSDAIDWMIASNPPVVIRDSTDGVLDDASVTSMSPIKIVAPDAGAGLAWQSSATYDFVFTKSGSPIVHATRSESLSATVGTTIESNEPQAPTAIDQITIWICRPERRLHRRPRAERVSRAKSNAVAISIVAPSSPGTSYVQLDFQRQFKCTADAIDTPLTGATSGIMIVD